MPRRSAGYAADVQTFLPFADVAASAAALDDRRLGKQRVEAFQILRALTWPQYGWKHHPAVGMWRGFVPALVAYGLGVAAEWTGRGHADTTRASLLEFTGGVEPDLAALAAAGQVPPWLGRADLHRSHRSALLRKLPDHYGAHADWSHSADLPDDLPYVWPRAAFRGTPALEGFADPPTMAVDEALDAAGLAGASVKASKVGKAGKAGTRSEVRARADAVLAALRDGRDVAVDPSAGGDPHAWAVLAGLTLPGRTAWIDLAATPVEAAVPGLDASSPPPATATPGPSSAPGPRFAFPRPGQDVPGPFALVVLTDSSGRHVPHRADGVPGSAEVLAGEGWDARVADARAFAVRHAAPVLDLTSPAPG